MIVETRHMSSFCLWSSPHSYSFVAELRASCLGGPPPIAPLLVSLNASSASGFTRETRCFPPPVHPPWGKHRQRSDSDRFEEQQNTPPGSGCNNRIHRMGCRSATPPRCIGFNHPSTLNARLLHRLAMDEASRLLLNCCRKVGANPMDILDVCIVGNTVMPYSPSRMPQLCSP